MNIHDDLDPTSLSPDQDAMVRRELEPGEKLVWLGRPIARRIAVGLWPIAIFGLVFSWTWACSWSGCWRRWPRRWLTPRSSA